jgi:hypothetical protein
MAVLNRWIDIVIIHAQLIGDEVLLPRSELERLLELARQSEAVDLELYEDAVPTRAIMRWAERGGAFDFWSEDGENIYSAEDGKPI